MVPMIELAGLTKVFGQTRAVDDLTCSVEPGMVTGFLGPNGAGKTATMRLILGLDHPTAGTATIDGKAYRELRDPLRTVGALLDARQVGAISLFAALAAVLGVAVAALLRHSAGAVAVLLMWPLVAEPILGNLPNIGSEVGPYLPFGNAFLFTRVEWLYPVYDMPWGERGSLLYFAAVVAVVFAAAIVVVNRRDA
jgi:energy-coupling factor transporter ATP-binding protein EcfA2